MSYKSPISTTSSLSFTMAVTLLFVQLPLTIHSFFLTWIPNQNHNHNYLQYPKTTLFPSPPPPPHHQHHHHITTRNNRLPIELYSSSSNTDTDTNTIPINVIPDPNSPNFTPLESEFYSMMQQFATYTPRDISLINDIRYRALYEGVAAGATEPKVLKAFAIVYQDYIPVRIAGRMIYNHLKDVMETNIKQQIDLEERVKNTTGLSRDAIDNGRKAFSSIILNSRNYNLGNDVDDNNNNKGEGLLSIDELVNSGIIETIVELLEFQSFHDFSEKIEKDKNGKFDFEMFMIALQRCSDESCNVNCNVEEILGELNRRMEPIDAQKNLMSISQRKKKYSDRYDDMVKAFEEWESLVPDGDGRMIEVLRGCFDGARNEKIVNALKIVYMDYSALRVGGDLVFKLMKSLINKRKR